MSGSGILLVVVNGRMRREIKLISVARRRPSSATRTRVSLEEMVTAGDLLACGRTIVYMLHLRWLGSIDCSLIGRRRPCESSQVQDIMIELMHVMTNTQFALS